ncbi:polyketide synthase [Pluteus cervinus]|uniref:Polyketide synthase n=1 Tax=Pluteus cervinus TaxID=181527 RepID=A0ACD3AAM3_9AGAR|nr:polyketide synthase [Pluteus cervinus]
MGTTVTPSLNIPVFAGHGTSATQSADTFQQALQDASTTSGSMLLSACLEAFHKELQSLSPSEITHLNIDLSHFRERDSLLRVPTSPTLSSTYLHNPIISASSLFLIQTLRYLAFVETEGAKTRSSSAFSDVLQSHFSHGMGILGFSSGILPACVVSTSLSAIAFVSHAVEVYRFAIWLGIRTHQYRLRELAKSSLPSDSPSPWSLVFSGMSEDEATRAITSFAKENPSASLYVTAVLGEDCVTISGHPSTLSAFAETSQFPFITTTVDTLYHSPIHVLTLRKQVLADVVRRGIHFPNTSEVVIPLRSSYTGSLISSAEPSELIDLVVDMLLTQPVHWARVLKRLVGEIPEGRVVSLWNFGPGAGFVRQTERAFPRGAATVIDFTSPSNAAGTNFQPKQEPIAIIGMAANVPGASDVSKLWQLLDNGVNTISEIPGHRFDVSFYNSGENPKRTMKAHTGNFVDGVEQFDNKFFKISPREAKSMDPQQRILLHVAYEALEDAGYVPNSTSTFNPETFGCYVGVATHDYLQNLRDEIDVYYSTGTLKAFLSGRISYAMQLSGPSVVIDTACSSSTVAVYQGARALMNRDCNAALVGGVNVISSPDMYLGLDRAHFLSPTGQCKAFDASADGYSRSEGCVMFVLKRLSDAIAEGDNVLGVIRGIEVNQSGLAHSITHPHSPTQATLFKQLLANSGIEPTRVNVVEAHGTGTQAGDPNELQSIRQVLGAGRTRENPLHITSIKANIGHLEAASGAAGLAKLLLMMRHRSIPPQISLKTLNPAIAPLDSDHTAIDTVRTPWTPSHPGKPRIALLNNFGAAGSNTTLLLEEYPKTLLPTPPENQPPYCLFSLSAKDADAAERLRSRYLDWLREEDTQSIPFVDIAYTSVARRQIYDYKVSCVARDVVELREKLEKATVVKSDEEDSRVVFVFSGQGGQYIGMGRELYESSPIFRRAVDECESLLKSAGYPGVLAIISPSQGSSLSELEEFEAYQAAIFTLQYALMELWSSWGVKPVGVVGHSLGEYAALLAAGVVSLQDALSIVAYRARLMVTKCQLRASGMLAVNLGSGSVKDVLSSDSQFSSVTVACYNSPQDCVLSGPVGVLQTLKGYLSSSLKCKSALLTVPFGYHSSAMDPLLEDLTAFCARIPLRSPRIPIVSDVLGCVVHPGDNTTFTPQYFAQHCRLPVQFDRGVQGLARLPSIASAHAWVELGPTASMVPMLRANPSVATCATMSSLRRKQDVWQTLSTCLSDLFVMGVRLNWRQVFAHHNQVSCASLPSYPFAKSPFWVDYKESSVVEGHGEHVESEPSPALTGYSLLRSWVQHPDSENGFVSKFEIPVAPLADLIQGHQVGGVALCPASVYIEQVLAGLSCARRYLGIVDEAVPALKDIRFSKPLVYDANHPRRMLITIALDNDEGSFTICSEKVGENDVDELVHVQGRYRIQAVSHTTSKFSRAQPGIARHIANISKPRTTDQVEVLSTRTVYDIIFPRVVEYSKSYQSVQKLFLDPEGGEGYAQVQLPATATDGDYIVHPTFVDTLLHVAGFIANTQGSVQDAFICSEVGTVRLLPELIDKNATYSVHCNLSWFPEEGATIAEAYAMETTGKKRIVAHLKGMSFRRVRLASLKNALLHQTHKPLNIVAPPPSPAIARVSSLVFESTPKSDKPTPQTLEVVSQVISTACGVPATSITGTTSLDALGVDSLLSIEIHAQLMSTFPSLTLSSFINCRTILDVVNLVGKPGASSPKPRPRSFISSVSTPRTLVADLPDMISSPVDSYLHVKEILASVLDVPPIDIKDDADFEDLGLDSLTSIEALNALRVQLGLQLPSDVFVRYKTSSSLQDFISSQISSPYSNKLAALQEEDLPVQPLGPSCAVLPPDLRLSEMLHLSPVPVPLQMAPPHSRASSPLFLIHDGSGLVTHYNRLLSVSRAVYGIPNPNFLTSEKWSSLQSMAERYARHIAGISRGPVILGGWSFGGVAAYEITRQLHLLGVKVKGLLLIDSPSPTNHVPLSRELIMSAVGLSNPSNGAPLKAEIAELVSKQFASNASLLGDYRPQSKGLPAPPIVMLRSKEGFNPANVAGVPRWLSDRHDPDIIVKGWKALNPSVPIKVHDIPGHHFQALQPSNMPSVSQLISESCAHFDSL